MPFPFVLPAKTYNLLKWVVMIALPAVSALYFGLSQIYGWSNAEQVVGTISLITVFLGTIIGVSSQQYNKYHVSEGALVIDESGDAPHYELQLDKTPEELSQMHRLEFKVEKA